MRQTFATLSGAALLLLGVSCGASDSTTVDAAIGDDALLGSGGSSTGGSTANAETGGATGGVTGGVTGGASMGGNPGDAGTGGAGQVCGGIAGLPCPKAQFCEYPLGVCSSIADGTGICTAFTDVCTKVYQPVCGCDGKTYGNDCERQAAGVSRLTDGPCSTVGKMCAGIAGFACDKGQFCDLVPGDCGSIADGSGTCAATGAGIACDKVYRPVCGCDGKTYGNDCERQVAGVSKLADGACTTTSKVCGGIAGIACAKGQFCEYTLGVCSSIADGTGTCATLTQGCPKIYQPVCGCDGRTYGNDCERQSAGVSKLTDGPCSTLGKMCAGIAGLACEKGQFCDLAPGDCGTIADGAGTCAATGGNISCPDDHQPVCGCNGKTYGNDCERRAAGAPKSADGACTVLDAGVER
jgi:Kazal-type serine protease inhibitor domain